MKNGDGDGEREGSCGQDWGKRYARELGREMNVVSKHLVIRSNHIIN